MSKTTYKTLIQTAADYQYDSEKSSCHYCYNTQDLKGSRYLHVTRDTFIAILAPGKSTTIIITLKYMLSGTKKVPESFIRCTMILI